MRKGLVLSLLFCYGVALVWAQNPITITIFIDEETLTIYVPEYDAISLEGLGFEFVVDEDERQSFYLRDYEAFKNLLENVPTPICFRLERDGSNKSLPQACNPNHTSIQTIASADVFWFNDRSNQYLPFLWIDNGISLGQMCLSNIRCELEYEPLVTPRVTSIPLLPTQNVLPTQVNPGIQQEKFSGFDFVLVSSGEFKGQFVESFWIQQFEVSNDQFAAFLNSRVDANDLINTRGSGIRISKSNGQWSAENGFFDHPAVRVTWQGADMFCKSYGWALPSRLQWEKAASWEPASGQSSIYPWGNNEPNELIANYDSTGTVSIDSLPDGISYIGAFNMSGNAAEWVSDTQGSNRFLLGGSWDSNATSLRTDASRKVAQTFTTPSSGFRCVQPDEF